MSGDPVNHTLNGWICSRCGASNSPYVSQCTCQRTFIPTGVVFTGPYVQCGRCGWWHLLGQECTFVPTMGWIQLTPPKQEDGGGEDDGSAGK